MSELNFLDTGGNKQKINTPAVNSIAFNTANTERVRINSTGLNLTGISTISSSAEPIDFNIGNVNKLRINASNIEAKRQINLESAGSYIKSNQLYFNPSGDAYIDHGVAGQSINFRMSSSSTLDTNAMTINHNGHITKPSQPSFHASRRAGDVGANNYVTFDTVFHNNGGHYNNSTGRFTAPVTGVYFFSAWNYTGSTSAFQLRINGSVYAEYTWDDTGGCGTWVCPMTSGQYAQIYTRLYGWRGTADYHNGFNGFLIG